MKDLEQVNECEQKEFFESFDHVLCDVDGVLLLVSQPIEGSVEAIKKLKKLDKEITIVSNNCSRTLDNYSKDLKTAGFDIPKENIIIPILAIVDYFRSISFCKQMHALAVYAFRHELEKTGFKLSEFKSEFVSENYADFQKGLVDDEKIGAVVLDMDINLNFMKLQKAAIYLKRPDVLFVTGGSDKKIPFGTNLTLIGPGCFRNILEEMTGREAISFGKPSEHLNKYLLKHCKIPDPKRVLFIGDTVTEDMAFAHKGGYKKLLVLSGATKSVKNWRFPMELEPDYYVDSLKSVSRILSKLYRKTCI